MAKKFIKRLGTIMIALALMVSMVIPAAAETASDSTSLTAQTKGTITINDADATDSFRAFTVMTVSFDAAKNTVNYTFADSFKTFLGSASNTTGVTTTDDYQKINDSDVAKTILSEYTSYCVANSVAPAYNWSGTASQEVALGQYVIAGAATGDQAYVYAVMSASFPVSVENNVYKVNKTVTITGKKTKPTLEKEITDKVGTAKDDQVAIGDTVNYSIVTTIPTYPIDAIQKTYNVSDVLSAGLTGHNNLKVYGVVASNETDITGTDAYAVTTNDGTTLLLTFDYDKIASYQKIKVTYGSVVNNSAVIGADGNPNTAYLEYSNNPYSQSDSLSKPKDEEKVYTYGLNVTKIKDGSNEGLQGAEFELYKDKEMTQKVTFTSTTSGQGDNQKIVNKVAKDGTVTLLTSGEGGHIYIEGLDVGTYYLKETKAPTGYALKKEAFVVTVKDSNNDGILDEDTDGYIDFEAPNAPNTTTLPQTGGIGTYVFIVIGLAGMAAAVIAFAITRKKARDMQ